MSLNKMLTLTLVQSLKANLKLHGNTKCSFDTNATSSFNLMLPIILILALPPILNLKINFTLTLDSGLKPILASNLAVTITPSQPLTLALLLNIHLYCP